MWSAHLRLDETGIFLVLIVFTFVWFKNPLCHIFSAEGPHHLSFQAADSVLFIHTEAGIPFIFPRFSTLYVPVPIFLSS